MRTGAWIIAAALAMGAAAKADEAMPAYADAGAPASIQLVSFGPAPSPAPAQPTFAADPGADLYVDWVSPLTQPAEIDPAEFARRLAAADAAAPAASPKSAPIPEPSSLAFLAVAALPLAAFRRRKG